VFKEKSVGSIPLYRLSASDVVLLHDVADVATSRILKFVSLFQNSIVLPKGISIVAVVFKVTILAVVSIATTTTVVVLKAGVSTLITLAYWYRLIFVKVSRVTYVLVLSDTAGAVRFATA
jgi:hypothetical protein